MFEEFKDNDLFVASFADAGEMFYFLGFNETAAYDQRVAKIRSGELPLVQPLHATSKLYTQPPEPPPSAEANTRPPTEAAVPPAPLLHTDGTRPQLVMPVGHKPVLVFDTETVGLHPPIVCQLAYVLVEGGVVAREVSSILKLPHGVRVQKGAFDVHGISTEQCARDGVDAQAALKDFCELVQAVLLQGGSIVGHNVTFDVRAIEATRKAHEVIDLGNNQSLQKTDTFCTMRSSASHSTLRDKANRRKPFKNEELYAELYGSPPTWARLHDALDDVHVTLLNYAGGVCAGWW